jgi:predicted RNA-binding Zn ribbon-like protein
MPKDASAPGSLELVRSFVNSVDLERPSVLDAFSSVDTARVWLVEAGLGGELHEAELSGLRALRETLRMELLAHNGDGSNTKSWLELARSLEGVALHVLLASDGSVRLEPRPGDPGLQLRDSLAAAIYDAVRDGSWARLKACRKHSCRYAFYDRSKNGSGAWCNMDTCGNRVKAERRRARERKAASD